MCGVLVFFQRCVYSSFHNRVDLIREPAFYWVFYFRSLALFVSSYVMMKRSCSFWFNRLAISWPPWVRVWGWASYRFLPFTVFSLGLPFCFSSYIVHLRCTSEGVVSMYNEPLILSSCGVIHERMLPCRVVVGWMDCIVYTDYVYPAFVSLLADISCLLFFVCWESVLGLFFSLLLFFSTMRFLEFYISGLLAILCRLGSLPD